MSYSQRLQLKDGTVLEVKLDPSTTPPRRYIELTDGTTIELCKEAKPPSVEKKDVYTIILKDGTALEVSEEIWETHPYLEAFFLKSQTGTIKITQDDPDIIRLLFSGPESDDLKDVDPFDLYTVTKVIRKYGNPGLADQIFKHFNLGAQVTLRDGRVIDAYSPESLLLSSAAEGDVLGAHKALRFRASNSSDALKEAISSVTSMVSAGQTQNLGGYTNVIAWLLQLATDTTQDEILGMYNAVSQHPTL